MDDSQFVNFDDQALAQALAVSGTISGNNLSTGSLDLAALAPGASNGNSNTVINQSSSAATALGVGPATIVLGFDFDLLAQSFDISSGSNLGNEGAVRLGLPSSLSGFTAGDYSGVGGRTAADDGHFVSVVLVPEPGLALLLLPTAARLRRTRRR